MRLPKSVCFSGVNQGGMPIGPSGQHMGPGQQAPPRKLIWQGDIEYHDRSSAPQRNAFKLHCFISSQVGFSVRGGVNRGKRTETFSAFSEPSLNLS